MTVGDFANANPAPL
jgi:hypothetical protein